MVKFSFKVFSYIQADIQFYKEIMWKIGLDLSFPYFSYDHIVK